MSEATTEHTTQTPYSSFLSASELEAREQVFQGEILADDALLAMLAIEKQQHAATQQKLCKANAKMSIMTRELAILKAMVDALPEIVVPQQSNLRIIEMKHPDALAPGFGAFVVAWQYPNGDLTYMDRPAVEGSPSYESWPHSLWGLFATQLDAETAVINAGLEHRLIPAEQIPVAA